MMSFTKPSNDLAFLDLAITQHDISPRRAVVEACRQRITQAERQADAE
jgi:hypothetical protein